MTSRRVLFLLVAVLLGVSAQEEDPPTASDLEADEESGFSGLLGSELDDCDLDTIGFELVTGYVYSAPTDLVDSIPGTLMLTDCLENCQNNDTCQAVNYETGLCVLFSSNADNYPGALTRSQFPVFTIYAQKTCLGVKPCERAWCTDRVQKYRLFGHEKRTISAETRRDCFEQCLTETEFLCRSANYNNATGLCELSDMDRLTVAGSGVFRPDAEFDYLENHCVDEPVKLCEFKKLPGRILKTVDSVYQDVGSADECRELCLNSPYRCHSYDYGDTGEMVCRLSHHSRSTLADIQEPYLEVPEAATYELSSCYNVSIECRSGEMLAKIKTSKLFNGKIYAKGSPNSCVQDVNSSLEFELRMGFDDVECNVRQQSLGRFLNDVVIQHHDTIVTSSDLGLAVTCQYDLTNKSVSNEVDLGVRGDVRPALTEEVNVDSPNVAMKITDRYGGQLLPSAEVGDPLALRFEILDKNSPYEIFVRELIAMDSMDLSEIILIDSRGCPTDHFIMGPLYKSPESGKVLISHFDAFKFPSSELVQFRALVTPCMPVCEPVECEQEDAAGELRSVQSYGRRKRSASTNLKENILVQSIHITDKFGFDRRRTQNYSVDNASVRIISETNTSNGLCIHIAGLVVAVALFLIGQLILIGVWTFAWRHRQLAKLHRFPGPGDDTNGIQPVMAVPHMLPENMCKIYESGSFMTRHY